MTDKKEIIIDEVNVAGCEDYGYIGKAGYWCYNYDAPCADYPNCYYKQLKRKEEELQAQRDFTTQEQRKIYCVAYDKTCETGNGCKQKKCVFKDNLKYKQTLTEIKEIAKENIRIADLEGLNGVYRRGLAEQILQKISEVKK